MLRKLFWFLSSLTIFFLGLQVLGYNVIEIIVSLILISLVVVEISRQEDKHIIENELKPGLTTRLNNIERICTNMYSSLKSLPTIEHMYHIAEECIQEHNPRQEFKENFDRIAKKIIEVENKLYDMKQTFSAGIGSLDDRIRIIEQSKEQSNEDMYIEE